MGREEYVGKMQVRSEYNNFWHTDLCNTLTADCPYFCFSMWCPSCASFLLRRRALYNDMSRYVCCAGYMPCSGKCGESNCPEFCLCLEVCLCFGNSVASTRFLLQDELNIQTTSCDNCIIGFMVCLQQIACIFSIIAMIAGSDELSEASELLNCIADYVYCTVCTCMQTQHKVEMDKRDGLFGRELAMEVPMPQQMSRLDQPYPPTAGYPSPQPDYGYSSGYPPQQGYPPPQQGYPPPQQGYPPPQQGYPPPQQGYPEPYMNPYPQQQYPPQAYQGPPPAPYAPPPPGYPSPGYTPNKSGDKSDD